MSTFLDRILETKRQEIETLRKQTDAWLLPSQLPPCRGFARAIREARRMAVIAEFKRASPSKGPIAPELVPEVVAAAYARAGAAAISVLTDAQYFQGSLGDLEAARQAVAIPVLRKDFIIDECQIAQARRAGADAILLIAAALTPGRLRELSQYAKSVGLDVLIEVHALDELDAALAAEPSVLGVNNRDLRTFEVSLETTREILAHTPKDMIAIAESGIESQAAAQRMAEYGARGLLVGESLMRAMQQGRMPHLLRSLQVELPYGTDTPPVPEDPSRHKATNR